MTHPLLEMMTSSPEVVKQGPWVDGIDLELWGSALAACGGGHPFHRVLEKSPPTSQILESRRTVWFLSWLQNTGLVLHPLRDIQGA